MKQLFEDYLFENFNLSTNERILLAVSGGADSVAMADLFHKTGFNCAIAHCNFHLRGDESDLDEKFVEQLAKEYNFPFYKIDFETREYAKEKGISIEMAARDLRYEWFEKIRQDFGYQYIAIAHHEDDVIETFFINLTRGTGIKGLSGIKEKNGHLIRPLLFANRAKILQYLAENQLSYRFDASNDDTKIIRNKLRHQILPLLQEINPAANDNILQTINNLRGAETIMQEKIDELKRKLFISEKEAVIIEIAKLKKLNPLENYLFELLRPFNFNSSQVSDIIKSLNAESGKSFYSATHLLVKDRNILIIKEITNNSPFSAEINEDDGLINLPGGWKLLIEKKAIGDDFKIPTNSTVAAIDCEKLNYPLKIRGWEQGDYFFPLGMNNKKKLSDFFIDQKISLIEKQSSFVLISEKQIVWVVGKRLDNRFKITASTKNVLQLRLIKA